MHLILLISVNWFRLCGWALGDTHKEATNKLKIFLQNKTSHCSPNWQWHQFHFWLFLSSHKLVIGPSSSGYTKCSSRSAFAVNTFYKVELRQHSMFIPLTLYANKTSQGRMSVCRFLCLCSPWWLKSLTESLELWKNTSVGTATAHSTAA